jgi:tetratricopeptide (TPR) repeat protein
MINKEHIMPTEITIKDNKRTLKGNVVRGAIFAGSKVLHVKTTDAEDFYLVYFQNNFIYGDKLDKVADGSFIDKTFQAGLVVEAPHPILSSLIPKPFVTIPNRSKVFSQIPSHFSPQERALIAATLDSFFEKDQLVKVIEQIYFDYRRNGKFMKAFQVLQISTDFIPQLYERLATRELHSYDEFYHSSDLPSIFKKDPLFAELYCYKNRSNPDAYLFLEEILKTKDCFVEMTLLWLENVRRYQKAESIEKMTRLALKFVTLKEWVFILSEEKINPFHVLPEARSFIEKMIKEGNYETAALALLNFIDDLPDTYEPILKQVWENLDAEFVGSHLAHFISILQRKMNVENQKQSELQISQLIVSMLKGYDLKTVYDKLLPLKKVLPHSMVIRKLTKMVALLEDPDHMMELGDHYVEFKQYDQAIDCYFWEMELKPQDPEPVWKICKMYQQKGMLQEAAEYQKVFSQLKNAQ